MLFPEKTKDNEAVKTKTELITSGFWKRTDLFLKKCTLHIQGSEKMVGMKNSLVANKRNKHIKTIKVSLSLGLYAK